MKRTRLPTEAILFALLLAGGGCNPESGKEGENQASTVKPFRDTQVHFKGVELYSWEDSQVGRWRFSLLPGTNRNKFVEEVVDPAYRIDDVNALKAQLAAHAVREQVFWYIGPAGRDEIPPGVVFGVPEPDIVEDIRRHCRAVGIELHANN